MAASSENARQMAWAYNSRRGGGEPLFQYRKDCDAPSLNLPNAAALLIRNLELKLERFSTHIRLFMIFSNVMFYLSGMSSAIPFPHL